jgi:RNA polymerase sigma-54 factor
MNSPALQTRTEHRQHQTLTPRLQHAVRLLQLSSLDFAQEVLDAMGKNPFLEIEEPNAESAAQGADAHEGAAPDVPESNAPESTASPTDADATWERENWQTTGGTGSSASSSGDSDGVMEMVAADVDLRQHLHGQINVMPLTDRDRVLVGAIIESLDDDGYLRLSLEELAALAELDPEVEECEMTTALKLVQSLDPCGVGARTVSECLLLQLECIDDAVDRELARHVITEQLDKLAQRDIPGLAKVFDREARTWRRCASASVTSTRGPAGASAPRTCTSSCPT